MALNPGDQVGQFEIVSAIGAGGMGEVYRARDVRLKREVALKVLLPEFARDPERYARFQREAEVLASLNHPNIATLHGLADDGLVMEFVEGESLPCPLPLDKAANYARQIAEALEYAHERGVIHRDLKPANIKVTPDGVVKLLDFGLAKALDNRPSVEPASNVNSPTLTLGHTMNGQILGTAAYMAPEQVEGKPADRRCDIWSFGAVLFEMLAGKRAFEGETAVETLASVMKTEPDWSKLPVDTPPSVRKLIERCLTKNRRQRLQAIGEARIAFERGFGAERVELPVHTEAPVPRMLLPWIAAGVFAITAAGLGFMAYRHNSEPAPQLMKLSVLPPEKGQIQVLPPALSPDGRHLAFGISIEGRRSLWLRDLDASIPREIPGSTGVQTFFWSPDSRWLAFNSEGKLRKIDIGGGPSIALCDTPAVRGGSWNQNGVILFATNRGGLVRVSASGGIPMPVTELDASRGEDSHRFPWFLPDGRHYLFFARSLDAEKSMVAVGDLDSKNRKQVLRSEDAAMYTEYGGKGYILYTRDRTLMAQPFDSTALATAGDPLPLIEHVDAVPGTNYSFFTASYTGTLAFSSGGSGGASQIRWFDRSGKAVGDVGKPSLMQWAALSPDGKTVATDSRDPQSGNPDIWLLDLDRGTQRRLTFMGNNQFPVWSPDGLRIAYLEAGKTIHIRNADGTGQDEILDTIPNARPTDWSRDGQFIFFEATDLRSRSHNGVWVKPLYGDKKMYPYVQTDFLEGFGKLSPDGHWLAYRSNETKQYEIYVVPFPEPRGKWQISNTGGNYPVWSRDGRELYFVSADNKLMAVDIQTSGAKFKAGIPKPLFDVQIGLITNPNIDVSNDGRFLIPTTVDQGGSASISIILNWGEMLRKK